MAIQTIEELRATIIELKLSNPYDAQIPKLNQLYDSLLKEGRTNPHP